MKKYVSASMKRVTVIALLSVCTLLTGIILTIADHPNSELKLILVSIGSITSILFGSCFFAERSRYLLIDEEMVDFPQGCTRNEKTMFQRTRLRFDEICSVKSKFHKGASEGAAIFWGLLGAGATGDCYSYILNLKDDTTIEVWLWGFGENGEKEIFEMICQSVEERGGFVCKDPNGK